MEEMTMTMSKQSPRATRGFSISAIALLALLIQSACAPEREKTDQPQQPQQSVQHFNYPAAKTVDVVDDYHGTKVGDPYRWLEDADAPETKAFVDAQNELVRGYIDGPVREKIKSRLTELLDYPKISPP